MLMHPHPEGVSRVHFRRAGGAKACKGAARCDMRASFDHKALKSHAFLQYQIHQNWLKTNISKTFTMLFGE
jgi:hypothetical protein